MDTSLIATTPISDRLSRQERMHVFVHLVHGFGARRWAEVADARVCGINDRMPYGYYRAAGDDCTIEYSQDCEEWRLVTLARLAARRVLGFDLLHAWRNRNGILNADVIWTHTELEHLAILLLLQTVPREQRPKLIAQSVWLYDRWAEFSRFKRWLYRKLLDQADLLTVLSPVNQLVAKELFPHQRVEFLKFGIDHDALTEPKQPNSDGVLHLLALGRDMHRDWDTLLRAVRDFPGCELRIGTKALSRKAATDVENITLVTPETREEIAELYRWADIFVLPLKPNFHASGITVLEEAALFGVPVIATDTGGLRAYFSSDEVRYVAVGDPAAMRHAIDELAANRSKGYNLAIRAQERIVRDELTSTYYAARHKALSHELIRQPFQSPEKRRLRRHSIARSHPGYLAVRASKPRLWRALVAKWIAGD